MWKILENTKHVIHLLLNLEIFEFSICQNNLLYSVHFSLLVIVDF